MKVLRVSSCRLSFPATRRLGYIVILAAAVHGWWAFTHARQSPPTPATLNGTAAANHLREAGLSDSLQEALAGARYTVNRDAQTGAYQAVNEANGLRAEFTPDGVLLKGAEQMKVEPSDWTWTDYKRLPVITYEPSWEAALRFTAYGYGDTLTALKGDSVTANGSRVEIRQSAIRNPQSAIGEWYDNRPDGLEQGFQLPAPPAGANTGQPLRLILTLSGALSARAEDDGKAINLLDQHGLPALRYSHLLVRDANGHKVPARLRAEKQRIVIEIDDAGAAYPLAVDPVFTQAKKLTAATGVTARGFGAAVAVDGNTLLVGAPNETSTSGTNVLSGAAYVFVNNNGRWEQQARLGAADGSNFDTFGAAVAIQGDTAVIGSPGSRNAGGEPARGAVYIFTRNGTNWTQQAKLTVPGTISFTQLFGNNVSLDGNTLVTGATGENFGQGAGYIFVRNGTTWTQQARFEAEGGNFGASSAIRGDTAIIGATSFGAAYVFTRTGATWTRQTRLTAADTPLANGFGRSISYDGNTVLIGANTAPQGGSPAHGAAYVFTGSGANWTQQAKLVAPDGQPDDDFGFSVALSGGTALIGARFANVGANANQGAAYVFTRYGTTWPLPIRRTAPDGAAGDQLGFGVALQGNNAFFGANLNDAEINVGQGAVYAYGSLRPNLGDSYKIFVTNDEPRSRFGNAVAISGDTVLVGVGQGAADTNFNRGQAFIFIRAAGGWALQATLVANDRTLGDRFGSAVALRGNTALIGAPGADLTPDGDQGAAYVFVRNGSTWTQQTKLIAQNSAIKGLGNSVALTENTALVGASLSNAGIGAAYVFVYVDGVWTHQAILADSTVINFGNLVALDGNTALVVSGESLKNVHVFTRSGTTWAEQTKFAVFGARPLAFQGNTALIGGWRNAFVFVRTGTLWSLEAVLTPLDPEPPDENRFGRAVALDGNTALIGTHDLQTISPLPGAAYVFVRTGTTWTQDSKLTVSDGFDAASFGFGFSVALEGDTAIIGAPYGSFSPQNSVYIFRVLAAAGNTPPTLRTTTDNGLRQGSTEFVPLAIVSDVEQSPETLALGLTGGQSGVTINGLQTDASGTVRGTVHIGCAAPSPTPTQFFTLTATDAQGAAATLNRIISFNPNTPPALAYPNTPISMPFGSETFFIPTLGPSDNGTVSVAVQSVTPAFAGQVTVNPTNGAVSISNATPAGTYTVTIRATDNCSLNADASFTFTVTQTVTTTTTLTSSRNPSLAGQPVTFTANIAFPTGIPTGAVTFTIDGTPQPPVTLAGGQAALTVPNLSLGLHIVTADYPGNSTFPPSSDRLVQSVIRPIPTAWTTVGSTGAVDEDDYNIMELDGPRLGARANGVVNARYNVVAVEDANFEGAANQHVVNVSFRDTDGAGTQARVQLTLYRQDIAFGGGTVQLFAFDSNNFPATGNRDVTMQLNDCATGTGFDFDFSRYVYWVEAVITRADATQRASFSGIQITELETQCP